MHNQMLKQARQNKDPQNMEKWVSLMLASVSIMDVERIKEISGVSVQGMKTTYVERRCQNRSSGISVNLLRNFWKWRREGFG